MSGSWRQSGRCIGEWRREVVVVIKRARHQRSLRSWNCSVSWLWWWIYEPTQAIELLKLNTHTDEYKQNQGNSKMEHLYQQ